jgi:hypothetical protein
MRPFAIAAATAAALAFTSPARAACPGVPDASIWALFSKAPIATSGGHLIAHAIWGTHAANVPGSIEAIVGAPANVCTGYVEFSVQETGQIITQQFTAFVGSGGGIVIRPVAQL